MKNPLKVEFSDGLLKSSIAISADIKDSTFAFYVFRNEERIETRWYTSQSFLSYNTEKIPGYYKVVAFIKKNDNSIVVYKSKPIFANPVTITENFFPKIKNIFTCNIKTSNYIYPALYFPPPTPTEGMNFLFVMLPSAVDRNSMELPCFHRWTWALDGLFPGSVLCIADPTLEANKNLSLGWLIGNKTNDATKELAYFIKKFAKQEKIPEERIVFYGSSAGGFAALALAAHVEGSVAVSINSQTEILMYENTHQVSLIKEICFETKSTEEISLKFRDRISMSNRWKSVKKSKAFIVQNETDTHHYNEHFMPFIQSLGGIPQPGISYIGKHTAWLYQSPGGHISETKEMAKNIISIILKKQGERN